MIIQSGVMLFSLVLLWSCNPDLPYPTRQSLSFATTIILCAFMVLCGVWVMYSLWKGVVYYAAVRKEGRARGFESMELDSHYDYAQPLNGKGYGADGEYSDDTHYVEDDQYVHYHDEDKLLPSYNPEPITLSFGSSPKSATGPLANPATQRSRWSTAGSGAGGSGTGHSSKSKKSSRHAERAEAGSEAVPSFDDIMRNPRSSQYVAPAPEDPSASLAMEDPSMEATSRANATLESVRGKMKSYSSKKSTSYDG